MEYQNMTDGQNCCMNIVRQCANIQKKSHTTPHQTSDMLDNNSWTKKNWKLNACKKFDFRRQLFEMCKKVSTKQKISPEIKWKKTNLKQVFERTTKRFSRKIAKSVKLRQLSLWWVIENKLSNTRHTDNENNRTRSSTSEITKQLRCTPKIYTANNIW